MEEFVGRYILKRVNVSLLKPDISSKTSKVLLFYTPPATLEIEKSNSSSFSKTITVTNFAQNLKEKNHWRMLA